MADFDLNDSALQSILDEVERDLVPVLKTEHSRLAKTDGDGDDDDKGEGSSESAPPSGEGSSSAPPGVDGPPAEASSPGIPPGGPEATASAPSPGPEGSASPGLPTDPAQLAQLVAQLPPEQVKALYLAAKEAIFAQAGGAPGPEASASAPPAGPAAGAPPAPPMAPPAPGPEASASAAPPPPVPPMGKAEMKPSPGNGGKQAPVKKAEPAPQNAEISELKKLLKTQNDQIELLSKAVTAIANTPLRKAITGVSHIAKTDDGTKPVERQLTKSEFTARLREKARDEKLSKNDRAAIKKFYENGSNDIDLVKHLVQ